MQLVAYGAQDTWLTECPDITFFRTTYTLCNEFNLITPAPNEFARQIVQIDWPRSRIPLLPDHLVNLVFRMTSLCLTCLRHGRFETAIMLFKSDKHTREWGARHPCQFIKTIYALLKDEQQKEEEEQKAPPFEH